MSPLTQDQIANLRRERDAIKRQLARLFDAIEQILEAHDPIGINDDEVPDRRAYEPEVGTILPRLVTAESLANVQVIIQEEFQRWFGISANRLLESDTALPHLAETVRDAWQEFGMT